MSTPEVKRIEPEMSISSLKDGTIVEVIPRSEFWTSVVIVLIVLTSVPYLAYAVFKYYDLVKPFLGDQIDDKETYENMYIAAIVIVVLLSISSIIFISFYFKNYTKRAFAQDKISIKEAFQSISREIAQHAADEYSDEQVDNHMEDMATLGGRIMAAKQGDGWYNDPKEFRQNYTEIPGEGYRRFTKNAPPKEVASSGAPVAVQGEINRPVDMTAGGQRTQEPTDDEIAMSKSFTGNPMAAQKKRDYFMSRGFSQEDANMYSKSIGAPYVPW